MRAYVDGSYRNGKVGWGVVIVNNESVTEKLYGVLTDDEVQGTRQVAGELKAVQETINWCLDKKIDLITICYDYKGIECWVTGEWKAKLPLTQAYRDFVRKSGIKIKWEKIKSHSGNKFNDIADILASKML